MVSGRQTGLSGLQNKLGPDAPTLHPMSPLLGSSPLPPFPPSPTSCSCSPTEVQVPFILIHLWAPRTDGVEGLVLECITERWGKRGRGREGPKSRARLGRLCSELAGAVLWAWCSSWVGGRGGPWARAPRTQEVFIGLSYSLIWLGKGSVSFPLGPGPHPCCSS